MGDARNKRRVEAREEKKHGGGFSIPLVVTFRDVGVEYKQRVVLFCSELDDPPDEDIVSEIPVRGELTMERKEDIVLKFATLFTACMTMPGEGPEKWKIGSMTARAFKKKREGEMKAVNSEQIEPAEVDHEKDELWPQFTKR